MSQPQVKNKPRGRNKDGRWRKKRSDTGKSRTRLEEGEVERSLQVSDEKQENGKDCFSDQVVVKIQEGLREHRLRKLERRILKFAREQGGHLQKEGGRGLGRVRK